MLIFTYLEQLEDLARLRTSRAEARPVVEPLLNQRMLRMETPLIVEPLFTDLL